MVGLLLLLLVARDDPACKAATHAEAAQASRLAGTGVYSGSMSPN